MVGKHSQAHNRQSKNICWVSDSSKHTEKKAIASGQINTHFKTLFQLLKQEHVSTTAPIIACFIPSRDSNNNSVCYLPWAQQPKM